MTAKLELAVIDTNIQISFRDPDGCGMALQWPADPATGAHPLH